MPTDERAITGNSGSTQGRKIANAKAHLWYHVMPCSGEPTRSDSVSDRRRFPLVHAYRPDVNRNNPQDAYHVLRLSDSACECSAK